MSSGGKFKGSLSMEASAAFILAIASGWEASTSISAGGGDGGGDSSAGLLFSAGAVFSSKKIGFVNYRSFSSQGSSSPA